MKVTNLVRFLGLLFFAFLSSCSEKEHPISDEDVRVLFSVDEFESGDNSRTAIDPSNNYAVTWASEDAIGIFPREGYQEPFIIPANQVGKSKAEFDGGYWALKNGLEYNAYYPFDKANFESAEMKTKIPVSYIGQEQNGTTCSVGTYDYLYSDWNTAEFGAVSFNFHHLGSLLIMTVPLPTTATYTSVSLNADTDVIPTQGTYDLTAEAPEFVADNSSLTNSLTLKLNDYHGLDETNATFYMMMPPVDLSNNSLTLTLTDSNGNEYNSSLPSVNIEKAKLIHLTATPIIPNNEIWYTSSDGEIITPQYCPEHSFETFGANMLDNSYKNGKGIITLDNDVTKIGDAKQMAHYAFSNCSTLTSVIIPNSVTVIGLYAFENCSSLTSITIPQGITLITRAAFIGCSSLTNIVVEEGNSVYDSRENCNAIIETATNELITGCKATVIPETVTTIGGSAFSGCSDLTSITIPEGVTSIGLVAFAQCSSLTNVTLPNSINEIKNFAFSGCNALTRVDITRTSPPQIGNSTFDKENSNLKIYVPAASLEAYKTADYWKNLNIYPNNQ